MFPKPYLIFVGDVPYSTATKTALGVRRWAPQDCVGQWRLSRDAVDLELPDFDARAAAAAGARSLLLGIAPIGGQLPTAWIPYCIEALEHGLDLVNGLHVKLADIPEIADAARRLGRSLHDVRYNRQKFAVATGRKRTGMRLLTVGTDCAQGKKYTALALTEALRARGVAADFRATGQTGVMISGSGIVLDTVVADFVAGAAETLSPDAADDHWDVIEGQGAIFHPAYAGVTLSLLHGSQPDALVLCHDPTQREIGHYPGFALRSLRETMQMYRSLARVTNPRAQFVGISLNTCRLSDEMARRQCQNLAAEHGLPCFDPLRFDSREVVDRVLALVNACVLTD